MLKPAEPMAHFYGSEPGAAPAAPGRGSGVVLDLVHLSRQTFGDHALEKELLTLFDRQAAHFSARLMEPCDRGAAHWRAEIVHTLKGSARSVGAFVVGDAAEAYEAALRKEGANTLDLERDLAAAIETTRAAIAGLFAGA